MKNKYDKTLVACFVGYIVQAICCNFLPLLFVTFQKSYGVTLNQLTLLATFNFFLQLCVDGGAVYFVDRLGFRVTSLIAHGLAALGLILLTFLPDLTPTPFSGLLISVMIYGAGGGLIEAVVSPLTEACPTPNKSKALSLLHSFYCWGAVGVILISTVFFALFGTENWRILTLIWVLVPVVNGIAFTRVPMATLLEEGERGYTLKELFGKGLFFLLMLAMICAGAAEQGISQWASMFCEKSLGMNKSLGDVIGPASFIALQGVCRLIYGRKGDKIPMRKFILICAILCLVGYPMIAFAPVPVIGLIGFALAGFANGIFWPGVLSMGASSLRRGGTALFCLLALGGNVGCTVGPTLVGFVSGAAGNDLKTGILASVAFPAIMIVLMLLYRKAEKKDGERT